METLDVDRTSPAPVNGPPKMSFRDTLMGTQLKDRSIDPWDDDDSVRMTMSNVLKKKKKIVQLFVLLKKKKIKTLWRPKSNIELVALDNDYFLVNFASIQDYHFAKYEGAWMIMDHYLIVKEWFPNFDPSSDPTEKVLVWVRFLCLPIEYYDQAFLIEVGEKIGRPVKIDQATDQVSRGKFARLCVEVDITKPLLAKFKLRRRIHRIKYEGIHLVCFQCGVYGHRKEICSVEKVVDQVAKQNGGGGIPNELRKEATINAEIVDNFGPWMLVGRKSRRVGKRRDLRKKHGNVHENKKDIIINPNQSSFAVLENLNDTGLGPINDGPKEGDVNNSRAGGSSPVVLSEKAEVNLVQRKSTCSSGLNKPAAESEHIVVLGSQGGKNITREVVNNALPNVALENSSVLENQKGLEHHQDPPGSNLMEDEETYFSEEDEVVNDSMRVDTSI
ncbi:hypothetical protein PTKIN_Ptkin03bG0142800 [Pterospermum kingtungense]